MLSLQFSVHGSMLFLALANAGAANKADIHKWNSQGHDVTSSLFDRLFLPTGAADAASRHSWFYATLGSAQLVLTIMEGVAAAVNALMMIKSGLD